MEVKDGPYEPMGGGGYIEVILLYYLFENLFYICGSR